MKWSSVASFFVWFCVILVEAKPGLGWFSKWFKSRRRQPESLDSDSECGLETLAHLDYFWAGHPAVMDQVLELQSGDPCQPDLHLASKNGDLAYLMKLVDGGCPFDKLDCNGFQPIHFAVQSNEPANSKIIRFLAHRGANVNAIGSQSQYTPAMIAAKMGHFFALNTLKSLGADMNARDKNGRTALHFAGIRNHVVCMELLVNFGCDPNAKDEDGMTAAHYAARQNYPDALLMLRDIGADLTASDQIRRQPIHMAAIQGGSYCVQTLVQLGCDPNASGENGLRPLHYAVQEFHPEIIITLVQLNADLNAPDEDGNTPLHLAARLRNKSLVDILLTSGAKRDVANKHGEKPVSSEII